MTEEVNILSRLFSHLRRLFSQKIRAPFTLIYFSYPNREGAIYEEPLQKRDFKNFIELKKFYEDRNNEEQLKSLLDPIFFLLNPSLIDLNDSDEILPSHEEKTKFLQKVIDYDKEENEYEFNAEELGED